MAKVSVTHKRGTTFRNTFRMTKSGVSLLGLTIKSTVRTRHNGIGAPPNDWSEDLVAVVLDDDPSKVVVSAVETGDWPITLLACDVRAERDDGEIFATETFYINCVSEVTE